MTPSKKSEAIRLLGHATYSACFAVSALKLAAATINENENNQLVQDFEKSFFQVWNFLGFLLYGGAGVISAITWTKAKAEDDQTGDIARNYDAALTMSALCIINSLIYFVDFIFAKRARNRFLKDRW